MADTEQAANVGEQASNTPPTTLVLKPEDQFRLINQRLDALTSQLGHIAAPAQFRLGDGIQIAIIVMGLVIAGFTAFGLSERISDLKTDSVAIEGRVKDAINASELRLGSRLDKLSDQFKEMDERTSRVEGELQAKKP